MTDREQALVYLRQYLRCREVAPWIADRFGVADNWSGPRFCLQRLGGLASAW